jgi:hypothetical protein
MKSDPIQPLFCRVRYYGATYVASGEKITASCTAGADFAARAWAAKAYTRNLGRPISSEAVEAKLAAISRGQSVHEVPVTYRCEVVE